MQEPLLIDIAVITLQKHGLVALLETLYTGKISATAPFATAASTAGVSIFMLLSGLTSVEDAAASGFSSVTVEDIRSHFLAVLHIIQIFEIQKKIVT